MKSVIIIAIAFILLIPISAFAVEETMEKSEQMICTSQYDPVCGISGETFSNRCVLESAGGIFDYKGECVGTEPELQRKILCGDGTIDIDGICQVEQIEEEKAVEKVVVQVEKQAKKSVNWFSSFFDWLGSLFG